MNEHKVQYKPFNSEHAKKWFEYGCSATDIIAKFMFLWISFNWIYNAEEYFHYRAEFNHPDGDRRDPSERELVLNCVDDLFYHFKKYDAFSSDAFRVFEIQPIKDERSGVHRVKDYRMLNSRNEIERVRAMFSTLYQVRCNLFHGSKRLKSGRDDDLIRSGGIILKGYLSTLFENNKVHN